MFGGGRTRKNGLDNTRSVFAFNILSQSWKKQAELSVGVRGAVAIPIPRVGILLIGGYANSMAFSAQGLLYDPEADNLTTLTELPIGLILPGTVLIEKWIYVFGGEDAPEHCPPRFFSTDRSRLLPERNCGSKPLLILIRGKPHSQLSTSISLVK